MHTESADVFFVFGNEPETERIPTHKRLMAFGSDVFNAMFHSELEPGDISIVDASAGAFKEFLQVFYFNHVKLTMKNKFEVVNLCKKTAFRIV